MRTLLQVTLLALAAVSLGCGSGTATLTGTVDFKGRKLTQGTVFVFAENGSYASGIIQPDGSYRIENCPTGLLKIAVASPNPADVAAANAARNAARLSRGKSTAPAGPAPPPVGDETSWFEIPDVYSQPDESGLTVDVSSGENQHDISIE